MPQQRGSFATAEDFLDTDDELARQQAWSASPARHRLPGTTHPAETRFATADDFDLLDSLPPVRITAQPDLRQPVVVPDPRRQPVPRFEESIRVTAPMPTPSLGGVLRRTAQGALEGFAQPMQDLGTAAASIAYPQQGRTFVEAQAAGRAGLEQAGIIAPNLGPISEQWTNPEWWAHTLSKAGGSMAGLAAVGALSGGGATSKTLLAALPESMAEGASVYNQLRLSGMDHQTAVERATGVFLSNLALLGVTNRPFFEQGAGLFRRALLEGGQEVGQQAVSNVATDRPMTEGLLEAGLVGGVAGGGAHVLMGGAATAPRTAQDAQGATLTPGRPLGLPTPVSEGWRPPVAPVAAPAAPPQTAPAEAFVDVTSAAPEGPRPTAPWPWAEAAARNAIRMRPVEARTTEELQSQLRPIRRGAKSDPEQIAIRVELQRRQQAALPPAPTPEPPTAAPTSQPQKTADPTLPPLLGQMRLRGEDVGTGPYRELLKYASPSKPLTYREITDAYYRRHKEVKYGRGDTTRLLHELKQEGWLRIAAWDEDGTPRYVRKAATDPTPDVEWTGPEDGEPPSAAPAAPPGPMQTARVEDILDTGEAQPRLPEVGAVREQDVATPEFEAPFSLTGGSSEAFRSGRQTSIFDEAPPAQAQTPTSPAADEDTEFAFGQNVPEAPTPAPAPLSAEEERQLRRAGEAEEADVPSIASAIAQAGGVALTDKDLGGEVRWLREVPKAVGRFGEFAGVRGVFRKHGKSLEYMAEHLRDRYPGIFGHIRDANILIQELADEQRRASGMKIPRATYAEPTTPGTPPTFPPPVAPAPSQAPPRAADAPTAAVRQLPATADTAGSPTRRIYTAPPQPPNTATPPRRPMSESQVVGKLARIFGHGEPLKFLGLTLRDRSPIPVGTGRMGTSKAFGIYKVRPQVIRLKKFGDLATFAHELGHDIDHRIFVGNRPVGAFDAELQRLGDATSPPSAKPGYRRAEGIAEFFRIYFANEQEAQREAPQFYAAFEQVLSRNAEMADQFARGRRLVQSYLAQDLPTRARARIDRSGVTPSDDTSTVVQKLETTLVDDLAALRRAVEDLDERRPVDARQHAYILARLARGAAEKASGFLRYGLRDEGGRFLGPSFKAALAPVRTRLTDFGDYLVAKRAQELRGRDIEPGMTEGEAREVIAKFDSPEFQQAASALYAFQRGMIDYAVRAGVLTRDQANAMHALNQAYVPFWRVMGESRAIAARRIAQRKVPVWRIKGSGRDIVDPLESIIRNTHALVDMVEKNRAMQAFVQQAMSTEGGGRFLDKIPTPQIATRFNLDQVRQDVRQMIEDAGLTVQTVMTPNGPALEVEGKVVDLNTLATIFTPATQASGKDRVITFTDQGERQFYEVKDAALYDAITAIGPRGMELAAKLFGAPARVLRAGATLTLGFIGRNPIRDTLAAHTQSRYGFTVGVDTLRGLFHYLKADDLYQQFLNSGAGGAALVSGDRDVLRKELRSLTRAGTIRQHLQDVVLHPIDLLRALSEASESATRIGEFSKGLTTERAAGRTAEEATTRAALAARDVTVDFSRGGTLSKWANQFVAFLNATVQGAARTAETFRRDPVGATIRATSTVTLLSIALWALNHDDEEYRELPQWEKDTYWHIKRRDGTGFIKIPKPQGPLGAVFGNTFEKALDTISETDPHAWKRLFVDDPASDAIASDTAKSQARGVLETIIPTGLLPIVESLTNYDLFRRKSIVSDYDTGLPAELQYNRWTSETAKILGRRLGLPPAMIDHVITGYGAGLAKEAITATDTALGFLETGPKKPTMGPARWSGVSAFYRNLAGSDAESMQELYRRRDALRDVPRTIRLYEAEGRPEQAAAHKAKFPDRDRQAKILNRAANDIGDLRDVIAKVYAHPTLTPDEKREMLDRTYERMVNIARQALGKPALASRFDAPVSADLMRTFEATPTSQPARR